MHISGANYVRELVEGHCASVKMVFNANGAWLFRVSELHREQKASGISYEDDYSGNALAAMLTKQQIEIRYHRNFNDAQVQVIIHTLRERPEMSVTRNWRVMYQGREVSGGE
jgi:hypothetical protein